MILPSSRVKKRYVFFEILCEEKLFKEEIKNSIHKTALAFLGEEGFSRAGILIINTNTIKVNVKYKNEIMIILSLLRKINGKNVMINTMKTSGIIKKVK